MDQEIVVRIAKSSRLQRLQRTTKEHESTSCHSEAGHVKRKRGSHLATPTQTRIQYREISDLSISCAKAGEERHRCWIESDATTFGLGVTRMGWWLQPRFPYCTLVHFNGGQAIPKVSWSLGVFSMYRNPIINHQFEDVLDHHGSAISGKSLGMVYEIGLTTRQITGFRRSSFDSPSDRRTCRRGWSMAMSRRRIMDAFPFPFHGDSEDNGAILRPLVEMANLWNPALSTNLAGWHRYPQLPYGHTHPRHERKYHVSLHRRPAVQGTFFSCQPFRRLSSKSWERWGMRQSYQLF